MQISVPRRFQGIEGMAQGGHLAGLVAERLPGPVTVSFRAPCPLETTLEVVMADGAARVSHDTTLILEAAPDPSPFGHPPPAVTWEEAEAARRWAESQTPGQVISTCFSCGTGSDSLRVHAGRVTGTDLYASPLVFPEWTAPQGSVSQRFLWAPIDCAAGWRVSVGDDPARPAVTGRLRVQIHQEVVPGEPLVVVAAADPSWQGRKRRARSAIRRTDGSLVASSESLWIALG
ncbi:MAG TPA: hypothetical protein VLB67_06120 [Acidimicrobiia bacterium]|nr:hypothetical protein [Acidimicrobiia bacterium]